MNFLETLIPFAGMAMVFGIVFVAVRTKHAEKMKMIEAGLIPEEQESLNKSKFSLIGVACLMIGLGVGFLVGNILDDVTGMGEAAFPASILIFGGLGVLVGQIIKAKKENK